MDWTERLLWITIGFIIGMVLTTRAMSGVWGIIRLHKWLIRGGCWRHQWHYEYPGDDSPPTRTCMKCEEKQEANYEFNDSY